MRRNFLLLKIGHLMPKLPARTWLLVVVPLALSFAALLSFGPDLQHHTSAALYGAAPSIYAAAHQDQLITFPSIFEWLAHPNSLLFAVIGTAMAISVFRAKTIRGAALSASAVMVILVSLLDVIITFTRPGDSPPISMSLSSNVAGGLLLFIVTFLILCVYDYIGRLSLANRRRLALFPLASALIVGTLVSALYLVLYTFYQPLPAQVEIVFKAPSSGALVNDPARLEIEAEPDAQRPFNVLPPGATAGGVEMFSGVENLEFSWLKEGAGAFDVDIIGSVDCGLHPDISRFEMTSFPLTLRNVESVRTHSNNGPAWLSIRGDSNRYTLSVGATRFYSIDRGNTADTFSMSNLLAEDASLEASSSDSMVIYLFGLMLNNEAEPIEIRSAGRQYQLRVGGISQPRSSVEGRCTSLPLSLVEAESQSSVDLGQPEALLTRSLGILMRITRQPTQHQDFVTTSRIATSNLSSVEVNDVGVDGTPGIDLGRTYALSVQGSISRLSVDGNELRVRRGGVIMAAGPLDGSLVGAGEIEIRGIADQAWLDGSRLNLTKWEHLSIEYQIFLIGAFGGVLLALLRWLQPTLGRLKVDEELVVYG